ncbi:MAG: DUF6245 family protein [Solirubrobacteraceae bacterium]
MSGREREAAWREQLRALGAERDPEALMGFLRQARRLFTPLREIAAREQAGPVPLATAHAADALHTLLEVIGAGQSIATADVQTFPRQLRAARRSLENAF